VVKLIFRSSDILVTNAELTVVDNKDKLIELNKKLDREIKHFNYLKESMEIIAYETNVLFFKSIFRII
jgi:hypothetical protein